MIDDMEKQLRALTETDEAICAASIENSILMRRIIRLMPRAEPTLDYLEMLYSYAKQRNRTADLVNALIGKNCPDVPRAGRDWYDWFQEVTLPPTAPDLFFLAWKYVWVLAKLEAGVFAKEEDAESVLGFIEMLKDEAGPGIIGLDDVVKKVQAIKEIVGG